MFSILASIDGILNFAFAWPQPCIILSSISFMENSLVVNLIKQNLGGTVLGGKLGIGNQDE